MKSKTWEKNFFEIQKEREHIVVRTASEIQMKVLEEAQETQQDFMKAMLEEQRQMDAAEREKDKTFLLQLGNLFAQK